MLCIPTASGKSLVAFMGLVNQIMTKNVGSRGIYIVPLALASRNLRNSNSRWKSWLENWSWNRRCSKWLNKSMIATF